ncbi:unnamed protein product, partial [Effrenium voratum]
RRDLPKTFGGPRCQAMGTTPRTRTPRMLRSIKPGEGVLAWKAYRDRQTKDLMHRSEYLATLVSGASEIETELVPPLEDLRASLLSAVPDVLCVARERLGQYPPEEGDSWTCMALAPRARTPRDAWPSEVPKQREQLLHTAKLVRARHRPDWQACSEQVQVAQAFDRDGTAAHVLHGHQAVQDACWHVSRMMESQATDSVHNKAKHRINTNLLKVGRVPGLHPEALADDHQTTLLAKQQRQQSGCKVVHAREAAASRPRDTSKPEMQFSAFLSQLMYQGMEATASRFERLDGLDPGSTFKFSVLGGQSVRREDKLPRHTMPPAIVAAPDPAPVFSAGHYFEVTVTSLFERVSEADRPRIADSLGRTAGMVLGFKAGPPVEEDELAKDISGVGNSWCISSNGWFFSQLGRPLPQQRRPMTQMRATPDPRPCWRSRPPPKCEQLSCPWPPGSRGPGFVSKHFDWSVALMEGDVLGLLVLPCGGLVMTVNGRRELVVADASRLAKNGRPWQ